MENSCKNHPKISCKCGAYKPHAVMMIGIPCSGKTTYGNEHYPGYIRISWDDTMLELYPSSSYGESFKLAEDKEVRRVMYQKLQNAVERSENIVLDLTHMGNKMRRKHLSRLSEGYFKTAVVMNVPREEINRRNEERKKEGKYIPEKVLEDMEKRYEEPSELDFDEIVLYNYDLEE